MGLFEAADGGFLFLDEVGDIELSLQGKLLRAIEERTIRRVGGLRDRRVDVRIVAATHRDLESEVKADRFRKDLYYRLAVITIDLPPLRVRGEDILLLAAHFLDKFNAKYDKAVRGIDDSAARSLLEYPWPGNVRELSHVIERAVLWSQGDRLAVEQLSLATSHDTRPSSLQPPSAIRQSALRTEETPPEKWNRSLITQALEQASGNLSKAAKILGVSRGALRYHLKKLDLKH